MQIIISDDAKSAITNVYDYSYNISSNYASRIVKKIYNTIYINYIFCSRQNPNSFFKVHEKELFNFLNHLFS